MRTYILQIVSYLLLLSSISIIAAQNTTAQLNVTATTSAAAAITTTTATPTTLSAANITTTTTTTPTTGLPPTTPVVAVSDLPIASSQAASTPTTTNAPTTITHTDGVSKVIILTTQNPSIDVSFKPSTVNPEDLELVKKSIQERIDLNHGENRLTINRPLSSATMPEFEPDSMEALVADATTQFGLRFINNLPGDPKTENVILSPLSLQNLLNMILLGSGDNSTTSKELTDVLGYDKAALLTSDRLKPHEAMREVFKSILDATHLLVSQSPSETELLNTNANSLNGQQSPAVVADGQQQEQQKSPESPKKSVVTAHLQTSIKEGDTPLSGQLNFTLANLVLSNKDVIELKGEYERDLKTYYNVNVEQFSRNATSAVGKSSGPLHERVNGWVKAMTQGQIEKLAEEADLSDPDLIMVLLNAAHFKGRWLHTFNPKATHERTFYNQGSESEANKAVKFMRQKAVFGYADFSTNQPDFPSANSDSRTRSSEDTETLLTEDAGRDGAKVDGVTTPTAPAIELSKEESRHLELTAKLNCSVLMLPFSLNDGSELSMVILLPAERDGVAKLQRALDQPTLNEIYRSLSETQVQVELPKFSFEGSHDARANLVRMGLKSIFEKANFDRMFSLTKTAVDRPASVDKVIHKAKISVDESGAEAAAASMASIVLRNFIRPPTPYFLADHPFLFIIRHNRSNMPLFMGRVSSL